MSNLKLSEIKKIKQNNPEHYNSLRKKIYTLKTLISKKNDLASQIEKIIRQSNVKDHPEIKERLIKLGTDLDDLLHEEKDLKFQIGLEKINLNFPMRKDEIEQAAEVMGDLFSDEEQQEFDKPGYSSLFKKK